MDIFEFALEKERLSEVDYHQLAEHTKNVGLKNIFEMLAAEEVKHCKAIEQMRQSVPAAVTDTCVLSDARALFEKMRKGVDDLSLGSSELELYEKARKIESESEQFYLNKADEVEDEQQRRIFLQLAEEEHKHFVVLENICDFVSEPQCYLENAEFVHLEDIV